MRVGFTRFKRKLIDGKRRSLSQDGNIYFMDDQDRIIGRLYANNIISLFILDEKANIQTLNLVYSFKYKCDQGVTVADVAFMSEKDSNMMPIVSKNRAIKYAEDSFMSGYEIASCGTVRSTGNAVTINIPMLGVDDTLTDVIDEITEKGTFYHLTTRTVR